METLRLYLRYIGASARSQLQYPASVIMYALGHLLVTGVEFFGLWALIDRFGAIRGFGLAEVSLLYGMANVSFAVAETAGRGFKDFGVMVKSGDFDRLLLRPRGTAFQVAAQQIQLVRIGRLIQGLAVLAYAFTALDLWSTPLEFGLAAMAMVGGACTFLGLFVLQATLAFWTVESLEVFAMLTYGGVETSQYPLTIYSAGFRRFFTYVVPLAFLNYVPGLVIMGRPERFGPDWLAWASPLVGVAFLFVCLKIWRLGERHYRSTGS
ncbi:MAG: ABC-2 family transporter protein [Myxococcota bacterium]